MVGRPWSAAVGQGSVRTSFYFTETSRGCLERRRTAWRQCCWEILFLCRKTPVWLWWTYSSICLHELGAATWNFGFVWLLCGAWRQTELVQVLCDGGASPGLWPGPASSPVVPVGLTASTVGQPRCRSVRSDASGIKGSGGVGQPVNIDASIFSNSLRDQQRKIIWHV